MVEQMTKQQRCLQGHCAAPLTLCPMCGWHRQQHHCQGEWGAPSQRGQLACWLQPGEVGQTWVHPSSCSGWRSLREGRLAEASVQQI